MNPRIALGTLLAIALVAGACTGAEEAPPSPGGPVTVRLLTHDSFDVSKSVLRDFEERTGITVDVVPAGDAGQLANRLILGAGNPEGDVAFGVDNSQIADLFAADVFAPYQPPSSAAIPERFARIDPEDRATPIDHGYVCVNLDIAAYAGRRAPDSLEDLADPAYRDELVVENPATSSPGLAFLLTTVAAYGDPGYLDYWRRLRDNGVLVVDGWERAYFGEFSGAGGGEGTRPLVVSYASSPVAEVVFADPPVSRPPTAVLTTTCYEQVEFAGILRGTLNEAAARQVVDLLLSDAFQEDIPLRMFVSPASTAARVPPVYRRWATEVGEPYALAPDLVAANRAAWVAAWADVMGQ